MEEGPLSSRGSVHMAGNDALLVATRLTLRTALRQRHFFRLPGRQAL
jgi:hypothetical protein